MKYLQPRTLTLFLFLIIGLAGFSQDKIYKKNQDVIVCKIVELGEEYVKYTQEDTDDLIFSIDIARIEKIVFASGKEKIYADKITDPELYYGQSKNAFKVGLFSPVTGALSFGYERSLKPGASLDGSVGLIGVGFASTNDNSARGAYLDAGYKFIVTPNYHTAGMRYGHLLRGFYFKPKVSISTYGRDFYFYNSQSGMRTSERHQVAAAAFMLDLGWQWIIGDAFVLNMYGGFGYGLDNMQDIYNVNSSSYYDSYYGPTYHYGFVLGQDVPVAFTAGLKIGFTK